MHLMGLNDMKLTYYSAGRNQRLTDTGGKVIRGCSLDEASDLIVIAAILAPAARNITHRRTAPADGDPHVGERFEVSKKAGMDRAKLDRRSSSQRTPHNTADSSWFAMDGSFTRSISAEGPKRES